MILIGETANCLVCIGVCWKSQIFVTMATGVGVIQILFAQLNSPTLKTLCFVQELLLLLLMYNVFLQFNKLYNCSFYSTSLYNFVTIFNEKSARWIARMKQSTILPLLCQMFTNFKTSFTSRLNDKCVVK